MLTFQPRVMESYLRTGLDLRRLVEPVRAFQRAPAPAAILYSLTSVAYNPQHLPEMRAAYEGTFFLDAEVTFVTERTVLRDGLQGLKVLLLPAASYVPTPVAEAIWEWVRGGGTVWMIGDSLTHDAADRTLPLNRLSWPLIRLGWLVMPRAPLGHGQVIQMPSGLKTEVYHAVGEDLFTQVGVDRPRRVVDADGTPLDGVEFRTVQWKGRELVYFINMNKATVTVTLAPSPAGPLQDLLNGGTVEFPLTLEPLAVVLATEPMD
jgi:hypothetical protein